MIQYQYFFRNFVIRRPDQIRNPPLPRIGRFELPVLAMAHWISPTMTNPWPTADLLFYKENKKPIRITHHTELSEHKGNPRIIPGDIASKIRQFRAKNIRFRPMTDIETAKQESRTIVTHNYSLLTNRYKYQKGIFSFQNRWHNVFATMFDTIGKNTKQGYHQYLEFTLPNKLPARSTLDRSIIGWNVKNMGIFNTYEMLLLHHLWCWMGEDRHRGLIHKYIPDVDTLKIIVRESDRFTVLDLNLLNEWRKPSEHERLAWHEAKSENPDLAELPKGKLKPTDLQRVFLRMMMSVMEVRNSDIPENIEDEQDTKDSTVTVDIGANDANVVDDRVNVDREDDDDVISNPATKTISRAVSTDGEITIDDAFGDYDSETDRLNLIAEIDKDLEVLEITSKESDEVIPTPTDTDDTEDTTTGPEHDTTFDNLDTLEVPKEPVFFPDNHNDAFKAMCDRAAVNNTITAAEYRRLLEVSERFEELPAPLDHDGGLSAFSVVSNEDVAIVETPTIPDIPTVFDKSMLQSNLIGYHKRYAREVFQKDVASMISGIRAAGIIVNNYEVVRKEDITGSHFEYTVQVKPIEGKSSTLSFKIPEILDNGSFVIGSTPYSLRMQRIDIPIRKIDINQIGLTSYYGKIFVDRSEKRVNDWGKWLRNGIMSRGLSPTDNRITHPVPGNGFDPSKRAPYLFTTISHGFRSFTLDIEGKSFACNFDMKELVITDTKPEMALAGVCDETGEQLLIGYDSHLYISDNNTLRQLPSMEELVGLDSKKAPVEFAELKVFAKHIPVGVVLGYLLGFEALLKLINPPSMRIVPTGKRVGLSDDEWSIVFDDRTYVFSRRDRLATLVLGGWRDYSTTTGRFPTDEFNKKDVYFNLFEEKKLGVSYLRELDILEQLFVDPITKELLVQMGEPVVFTKLLMRSCEMLTLDEHPNSQDTRYMRIRGYERFAGAVYSELVRSVRVHNGRPGKHNHGLELNPYAVWIGIQQDPAKDQVSEINPIQNLKETEAVTYSGTGGRGKRSMVGSTRIFHKNDMGVISESTVDSSDVAVNMYTSANPQFNSIRGTTKDFDWDQHGATSLLSTTALISPGSVKDDPKRVNFAGIQNRHFCATANYTQSMLRTGYEQIVPHRTGDLFATTAKKPGKVVSVSKDGIIVEYADGERQGIQLGRRYGNASGLTMPHTISTDLKEGDTFEIGSPIAYNVNFFERDVLDSSQLVLKSTMLARVALLESPDTFEDSSAISKELSIKLTAEQTKIKDIVVNFDQEIHRMVREGDKVEPESILCIIEDAMSARNDFLDEDTLDTLKVLGSPSPQAKIKGTIERIEVYYNGELEDMSESLRAIVNNSDKRIMARNASVGKRAYTGSVTDEFRIGTDPLLMDTACIRIYMGTTVAAGSGDKAVFANQLKTVIGRVYNDNVKTESGIKIDALFGATSLAARIVTSPYLIGTTTTLLKVLADRAIKAYES